jgi:hypothetical protein
VRIRESLDVVCKVVRVGAGLDLSIKTISLLVQHKSSSLPIAEASIIGSLRLECLPFVSGHGFSILVEP